MTCDKWQHADTNRLSVVIDLHKMSLWKAKNKRPAVSHPNLRHELMFLYLSSYKWTRARAPGSEAAAWTARSGSGLKRPQILTRCSCITFAGLFFSPQTLHSESENIKLQCARTTNVHTSWTGHWAGFAFLQLYSMRPQWLMCVFNPAEHILIIWVQHSAQNLSKFGAPRTLHKL